jgi:hypothetical protein
MARRIIQKGDNAVYIEHRTQNVEDDGREIIQEGASPRYEEHAGTAAPHFPLNKPEEEGRRLYELLIRGHFVARDTEMDCWLYTMGYSTQLPAEWKPIQWMKNVQLAQEMLRGIYGNLLDSREMTLNSISALAERCFEKDGKPLKLAKNKPEPSFDSDRLKDFFRPSSDL